MEKRHDDMLTASGNEIDRQRDNIAKIFDKLEAFGIRSEARHLELLNRSSRLQDTQQPSSAPRRNVR